MNWDPEAGYDLSDPKHPTFADRSIDAADDARKRAKETPQTPERARLEELRTELRAEQISYGELAELQGLAEHIEPGDTELLEAAGGSRAPEPERATREARGTREGAPFAQRDGLYVVLAPDVNDDGPIAAFADETLADELVEALGSGSVSYEPAADYDLDLLRALVERYLEP